MTPPKNGSNGNGRWERNAMWGAILVVCGFIGGDWLAGSSAKEIAAEARNAVDVYRAGTDQRLQNIEGDLAEIKLYVQDILGRLP